MPSRADLEAGTPKCDRVMNVMGTGPLRACGVPMRWYSARTDPLDGSWVCPTHGAVISGFEAATRAGFVAVTYSGADAA